MIGFLKRTGSSKMVRRTIPKARPGSVVASPAPMAFLMATGSEVFSTEGHMVDLISVLTNSINSSRMRSNAMRKVGLHIFNLNQFHQQLKDAV